MSNALNGNQSVPDCTLSDHCCSTNTFKTREVSQGRDGTRFRCLLLLGAPCNICLRHVKCPASQRRSKSAANPPRFLHEQVPRSQKHDWCQYCHLEVHANQTNRFSVCVQPTQTSSASTDTVFRSSSRGESRICLANGGLNPRSRAMSAIPAATPPPALSPYMMILEGSTLNLAVFWLSHNRAVYASST